MRRRLDCGRPAGWKATRSRWRTSATGPTLHTRPTCGLSPCPGDIRSPKGAGTSSPCACRSRERTPAARRKAGGAIAIELGRDLPLRMPELGVALPNEEIEAASAAVDALRALKPRFLVCHADMRRARLSPSSKGSGESAKPPAAKIVLEVVVPDEADPSASLARRRRGGEARAPDHRFDCRLERGRPEILAARRRASREADGRGDRQGGARGVSGGEARRRHALHLHRAQPQAAESGAVRFHHPHHLFDRPRGGRSVGDGDARNPPCDHRIDQSHDRRDALSHRPERHRGAHEPLRQGRPRQSRKPARLPHQPRPSPARPVQRRLDAWLCRRLRLWRGRVGRDGRGSRPAWVHSPPVRPTIRSPVSIRSMAMPSIRRSM